MTLYRGTTVKALNEELGGVRLTELTASDVQGALTALAGRSSTRTVQIAHNVLVPAIRHAERDDLVGRNVAAYRLLVPPLREFVLRPDTPLAPDIKDMITRQLASAEDRFAAICR